MNIRCYSDICETDDTLRPYQQKAKKEIFESSAQRNREVNPESWT